MSPERTVLVVGLLGGLLFVAATPPFQAPDEPNHFARAYQVSEGVLFPRSGGVDLPESVVRIGTDLRGDLPFHPERKVDRQALAAAFSVPLAPERRTTHPLGGSVLSTPLAYLPQALGAVVGRALGLPVLWVFYLCRLTNLLASLAVAWAAVRVAPLFRWLFAFLVLDPMALFLRSSLSADALIDALALLLVATVLALAAGPPGGDRRDRGRLGRLLGLLMGTVAFLVLSKGATYSLLPALAFLIPAERLGGRRRATAVLATVVALTAAGVALSGWAVRRAYPLDLRVDVRTDPVAQAGIIARDPMHFLGLASVDAVRHAPMYAIQFVGNLGWLDTTVPAIVLLGYALLLLALALTDGSPALALGPWRRLLIAAITAATLFGISTSQYLLWTAVGADHVDGIQGRYFLPLAPAAALLFHNRRWVRDLSGVHAGDIGRWLCGAAAVATAASLIKLWMRYYVG
jgi:uncharacterized membrane protein